MSNPPEGNMLKFGIYKPSQLLDKSKFYGLFGDKKHFSISLYGDMPCLVDRDEISQEILMQFSDARGIYKRTYSKRFEDFDKHCLEVIREKLPQGKTIVHDVGVSDARTSCDFYEKLCFFFADCEFYASDYNPDVIILYRGTTILVISESLEILETTIPPFVWNQSRIRKEKFLYPLNFLLKWLAENMVSKKMIYEYRKGKIPMKKTLSLFCQRAKDLCSKSPHFHLLKHNILDKSPISDGLSVLRAMNVLNPSFFSIEELQLAIECFLSSLVDGGLFITGCNQASDSMVNGAIYQKKKFCFVPVSSSGQGSAINNIIISSRQKLS